MPYKRSFRSRTNPLRYGRAARRKQASLGAMIMRRKGIPYDIRKMVYSYLKPRSYRRNTRYGYKPRNTLRR